MIKIIPMSDTSWYLMEVKKIFVHGNTSDKNFNNVFLEKIKEINNEMKIIGIKKSFFTYYDESLTCFENLILADFITIKKIFIYINNNNLQDKLSKYNKVKDNYEPTNPWNIVVKKYSRYSSTNINNRLVKEFRLSVCPYCNRDFINNRSYKNASAQLDHFYPKTRYPIFALCLYNLVPSCYTCNHIKQEKLIDFSPHDINNSFDTEFKFTYRTKSIDFPYDTKEIRIKFVKTNRNIEQMQLEEAYEIHNDYVGEIIKKAMLYNKHHIYEYLDSFPGFFESKEEILRIVFGNYIEEQDLGKRPLSKLTKDILSELGISTI